MTDIITLGIRLDASGVVQGVTVGEREFNKLANSAQKTTEKVGAIEKGFGSLRNQILAFASVATALKVFHDLVNDTVQAETSQKRLEGTLKATGHAAGLTATELADLADTMQRTTLVDDEKVKDAEAILMSFRKIQGDTFREAIKLSNDLAFTMGGDLTGAALQVGKALADPVQGIGALGRAGVKLSSAQEQQIKDFIKINDLAGAQKVIIDALRDSFGGAAEGAHSGLTGALHDVSTEYHEFLETVGKGNSGILNTAAKTIAAMLASMRRANDDTPRGKLNRLSDDIEREKRVVFDPGIAGEADRAKQRAKIAAMTAEYDDLEEAISRAEESDSRYAAQQGETAQKSQLQAEKEGALAAQRAENQKRVDELTKALKLEAGTLGMTAAQSRVYELRLLGASAATIKLAEDNARLIDSFDLLAEQHKQRVANAIGGGNATQTSGPAAQTGREFASDPNQVYSDDANDPLSGINRRVAANEARLLAKTKRTTEFYESMWKRAAENSQDAMADFLKNIGHGLDSAEELFKRFVDTVIDMLSQIASANMLGNSGSWFAKLFQGLLPGAIPGAPAVDTAAPAIPSLSLGMQASASGGQSFAVQQHVHFNVTAMDGASVQKMLVQQAPTIMGIVGQGLQDVPGALGGRRRR